MKQVKQFTTVDPLALLLSGSVYAKLTLPRPTDFEDERKIYEMVAVMSREEKQYTREQIKMVIDVMSKMERALNQGEEQ